MVTAVLGKNLPQDSSVVNKTTTGRTITGHHKVTTGSLIIVEPNQIIGKLKMVPIIAEPKLITVKIMETVTEDVHKVTETEANNNVLVVRYKSVTTFANLLKLVL